MRPADIPGDLSLAFSRAGLGKLTRFSAFCAVVFVGCAVASPYLFDLDPVLTIAGFPFWVFGGVLMGWSAGMLIWLAATRRPAIAETPTGLRFNAMTHWSDVAWDQMTSIEIRGYGKSMNIEVGRRGQPPIRYPAFLIANSNGEIEHWSRAVRARLAGAPDGHKTRTV